MRTQDPREHKALGRQVRGFDASTWDARGFDLVVKGNLAKFRQNPLFMQNLLATGSKVCVFRVRPAYALRACVCSACALRARSACALCMRALHALSAFSACLGVFVVVSLDYYHKEACVYVDLMWLACCSV